MTTIPLETTDSSSEIYEACDNILADHYFWITYLVERYYLRLSLNPEGLLHRTANEHAEAIISEVAEAMFTGDAAKVSACRESAWETICLVAVDSRSRLYVRANGYARLIIPCNTSFERDWFIETKFRELASQIQVGAWDDEYSRWCRGERAV
jgi:hypothetical protein